MIPKHVHEKIKEWAECKVWNDQTSAEYGYSLAIEQMKPILDAAREYVRTQNGHEEVIWDELDKLSQLLNQHDNENTKV